MSMSREPAAILEAPPGTARLSVRRAARVRRRRALATLGSERNAWLGDRREPAADPGVDRFLIDLELRVSEQTPRIVFRKAAYLDLGRVSAEAAGPIRVAISWRAAGLAPLFPVFSGSLTWDDGELRLDGYYAPPGGGLGIVADRLLLNVAARGTAGLLLERIETAMRGTQPSSRR